MDNNLRDQRMGENLIWLTNEHFKGRKVIAWMATFHAAHDIQQIKPIGNATMYDGVVNCGTVAHDALGNAMFTIGFTSADGSAGNVWGRSPMTLPPPSRASLEDICRQTEIPFMLIDFRGLPENHFLREPIVSRPMGYGEMSARWPEQMDAMFYIRTMFPSTREVMIPEGGVVRASDR
jgi:erythromycin esterase-like protein